MVIDPSFTAALTKTSVVSRTLARRTTLTVAAKAAIDVARRVILAAAMATIAAKLPANAVAAMARQTICQAGEPSAGAAS